MARRLSPGDRNSLPRLPEGFWQMTREVEAGWRALQRLLEQEWTILKEGRVEGLWKSAEKKKVVTVEIARREERLESMVRLILKRAAVDEEGRPWDRLRQVVDIRDRGEMDNWSARLRLLRQETLERNRRHHGWLSDRVAEVEGLTQVFQRRPGGKALTYGRDGTFKKSPGQAEAL